MEIRRITFKISSSVKKRYISSYCSGFTLPELLVATLIAAAIAALTGQVMIGQLLEGRRLDVAQRLRENLSRFNYLVQIEASEARDIAVGVNLAGCAAGTDPFVFWIPLPGGDYEDLANRVGIQYTNVGPNIHRCGPPVFRNGQLDHDADLEDGIAVRDANLAINPPGCPLSDDRQVSYAILFGGNLPGSNLGDIGDCMVARAKSVFVLDKRNVVTPP